MKTIFRAILGLLLLPFLLLVNLFSKPRAALIAFEFTFFRAGAVIKIKKNTDEDLDTLLQKAYLLFLARYFYICDDRQVAEVQQLLLDNIRQHDIEDRLTDVIYQTVFQTLNSTEQNALLQLFSFGIPPLTYYREDEPEPQNGKMAEYVFSVIERNNQLSSHLILSPGPDIILLPLLVGIFFEYTMHTIVDTKKKEALKHAIINLILSHEDNDPRSSKGFGQLPQVIIESMNDVEIIEHTAQGVVA